MPNHLKKFHKSLILRVNATRIIRKRCCLCSTYGLVSRLFPLRNTIRLSMSFCSFLRFPSWAIRTNLCGAERSLLIQPHGLSLARRGTLAAR